MQPKLRIALLAISMLIVVVLGFSVYLFIVPPFVDYGLDGKLQFQPNEEASISVYYVDKGGGDGSFDLVLKLINCTFSTQTEKLYDLTNSTIVKFTFSKNWPLNSQTEKTVFFVIDENVTGFAFDLHLEGIGQKTVNSRDAINYIGYNWNSTSNCYVQTQKQRVSGIA